MADFCIKKTVTNINKMLTEAAFAKTNQFKVSFS